MFAFHISLAERCEERLQLEEYDHFENLNSVQCNCTHGILMESIYH